jgi:hypothetical protein
MALAQHLGWTKVKAVKAATRLFPFWSPSLFICVLSSHRIPVFTLRIWLLRLLHSRKVQQDTIL